MLPDSTCASELYRITGIDWSQINGIDVVTAQTVMAEVGAELSAFASEKHFASWLGLCPTNEQSGGKILNRRTRKVVNRATVAFRNAASTTGSQKEHSVELFCGITPFRARPTRETLRGIYRGPGESRGARGPAGAFEGLLQRIAIARRPQEH